MAWIRVLYRSGDAVVLNESGDLGLSVDMSMIRVEIRGFRVELGEIEAVLASQSGVRQAAVVLRSDRGLDELVAFLVADDPQPSERDLRAALRKSLPSYMAPSRFHGGLFAATLDVRQGRSQKFKKYGSAAACGVEEHAQTNRAMKSRRACRGSLGSVLWSQQLRWMRIFLWI